MFDEAQIPGELVTLVTAFRSTLYLAIVLLTVGISSPARQEVNKQCSDGECLSLNVTDGFVIAERTGVFSPGTLMLGKFDPRGVSAIPDIEAPIFFEKSPRGWVAVASAYLRRDFLVWPQLRLRIFDSSNRQTVVQDLYNSIGKPRANIRVGKLFSSNTELLQVSTDGEHAYVVRTLVWLLPEKNSAPLLLLDVPGLVERVQQASSKQLPGFWIQRETYDGVHADTKGHKLEFWAWNEGRKTLHVQNP